ncbi:MAG: helix-hairpin-helix domain-containing protein [Armatimonadota bacterium]
MKTNRRGIALVLSIWILAALVLLAGGLALKVRTDVQVSRNFADLIRCRWAALAGINRAMIEVAQLAKQPYLYLGEEGTALTADTEIYELEDLTFDVIITDEAGKVNINTAPVEVLEALFGSREIAESIIDWRDTDDTPGAEGAESVHYESLEHPYRCKNAPFTTVRELLLVKGVTRDLLTKAPDVETLALEDCLTVYSTDKNQTAGGQARVNIKTANQAAIKTAVGDALSDQDIAAVISFRGSNMFRTAGEIINVPGLSREKVQRIYDLLTVSNETTLPGLVNVNTAPRRVLLSLPGMDGDTAGAIVAHREAEGPFTDVGQLLAVEGFSSETFAAVADQLTVRSQVFNIAASGHRTEGWPTRTVTCVVDYAANSATQMVYWRE